MIFKPSVSPLFAIEGQGGEPPAPQLGGQGAEPFFALDDGTSFSTKEEMAKAWKESGMMRSDYTQKTQGLAEERKKFEHGMEDFRRRQKENDDKSGEFKQFDRFVREHPDVYEELKSRVSLGSTPQTFQKNLEKMIEEKYGTKLQEIEQWKQQQEMERNLQDTFKNLKGKHEDLDEDELRNAMTELADQGMEGLMETLYFAKKGRTDPIAMEQRAAQNILKKKSAGLTAGTGTLPPTRGNKYKTIDEAHSAAMEAITDE